MESACFEQVEGAQRVGFEVHSRVEEAGRDGDLAGEVDDGVGVFVLLEEAEAVRFVADVDVAELEVTLKALQKPDVFDVSASAQVVEPDNRIALRQVTLGHVSADETGDAGDEDLHAER